MASPSALALCKIRGKTYRNTDVGAAALGMEVEGDLSRFWMQTKIGQVSIIECPCSSMGS